MRYAMVLLNNVIGIKEADNPPSFPPDPQGNPVTAIECDESVVLGMVYDPETGEFSEYVPPADVPTQADRIEERLKEQESSILDTAVNAEYLACLADLGL